MEFRFAVRNLSGSRSSSWKLWTRGEDVYATQRSAGYIHKFSFHRSRICRWALVKAKADKTDRVIMKWHRDQISKAGSKKACRLLSIAFPTNHLSAAIEREVSNVTWIEAAPVGYAIGVDIFLTTEDRSTVERLLDGGRALILYEPTSNNVRVCVSVETFDCGPVHIQMPREPVQRGQAFDDLVFPDGDERGADRPIRMLMTPQGHVPPLVWELGGYETSKIST